MAAGRDDSNAKERLPASVDASLSSRNFAGEINRLKTFLSAAWRNLVMANYAIDPDVLRPYLPCHTELDSFNGVHYVSLVGFLFENTRLLGMKLPFHHTFEEVNLRFYVRYEDTDGWKRGVVFMKEIVPKHMITLVANTVYGEKYATHPMRHEWTRNDRGLLVNYEWKVGREWNRIRVLAESEPSDLRQGSEEEFITEHYWGYTHVNESCTGVYEVRHPRWKVHRVLEHEIICSTAALYGEAFVSALKEPPRSVFLAEGSPIQVMKGSKLYRP